MSQKILVTAGLPYANGSIHLGHLVEYILTDVYVRALKMAGKDAIYICADDTHGTPIALNAKKAGLEPEAFVERFAKEHLADFTDFEIQFDSFYSTNAPENLRWVTEIYEALKAKGHITKKPLEQFYDEQAKQFLPDRFVKGTCPFCHTEDQYGDVCESCGKTYAPTDLKNPYSVLTQTTPIRKSSEHVFLKLGDFEDFLKQWVEEESHLHPSTRNFVRTWIESGLKDWCISRDAPYFGFEIPGEDNKFFYVWVDAPVGYISSAENWAKSQNNAEVIDQLWREKDMRLIHVIGKDIVYFHTLFWPAMLQAANLKTPDYVHVHGMLMVEGTKMSKSRGTFVNASLFKKHLSPTYLRYFYTSRLGSAPEDIDLSSEEMANTVNAELVNNIANLVSRGTKFLLNRLDGKLSDLSSISIDEHKLTIQTAVDAAQVAYEKFEFSTAVAQAVKLATLGNQLFQEGEPWKSVKQEPEKARDLVTLCLNIARAAVVLVAPATPTFAADAYKMLGFDTPPQGFEEASSFDLVSKNVGSGDILLARITPKNITDIFEEAKQAFVEAQPPEPTKETNTEKAEALDIEPIAEEITIDTFVQSDLRVGLIRKAEKVEGSKKLLRLHIDLGEGRLRNIFAGIGQAYEPETLEGKKVVVVANLKPRKMKFGVSEGMVCAAGSGGKDLHVAELAPETPIGSRVG